MRAPPGSTAIINLHHDGADGFKGVGWLSLKDGDGKTTDENNAKVRAQFVAVWTQIAKYFANHGEELIFESMNEIHDGYGNPDPRHYAIINELNQQFVNVVRGSGGNNMKRHLLVPGYNTNIDQTIEGFKLPTDPAKNRLSLSVHFYDPYLFTLEGKTNTWGTASPGKDDWGQEDFVVKQFDKLKTRYIEKGVPGDPRRVWRRLPGGLRRLSALLRRVRHQGGVRPQDRAGVLGQRGAKQRQGQLRAHRPGGRTASIARN